MNQHNMILTFPKRGLIFCFIFFSLSIFSQTLSKEEMMINTKHYTYSQPDSVKFYLKAIIKSSKKENDTIKARGFSNLGDFFKNRNQNDSAAYYYKKSIELGGSKNKIETSISLGVLYKNKREYDKAFLAFNAILNTTNDKKLRAIVYGEIASTYSQQFNLPKALEYFKKGIDYFEQTNMQPHLANQQLNLAELYTKSELYDLAIPLFEKSIGYLKNEDDKRSYLFALIKYASCLSKIRKTEQALQILVGVDEMFLKRFQDKKLLSAYYGVKANIGSSFNNENTNISDLYYKAEFDKINITPSVNENNKLWLSSYFDLSKNVDVTFKFKNPDILILYEKAIKFGIEIDDPEVLLIAANNINYLIKQNNNTLLKAFISKIENTNLFKKSNGYEKKSLLLAILKGKIKLEELTSIKVVQKYITSLDSVNTEKRDLLKLEINYNKKHFEESIKIKETLIYENSKLYYFLFFLSLAILISMLFFLKQKKAINKSIEIIIEDNVVLNNSMNEQKLEFKTLEFERNKTILELELKNIQFREDLIVFLENTNISKRKNKELKPYWSSFLNKFNLINIDFNEKLINVFPNLTTSDVFLCSAIKLNLSNKEISNILQMEYASVVKKKQRLGKKLKLNEEDLLTFIRNF
jgi:hypothetical protein